MTEETAKTEIDAALERALPMDSVSDETKAVIEKAIETGDEGPVLDRIKEIAEENQLEGVVEKIAVVDPSKLTDEQKEELTELAKESLKRPAVVVEKIAEVDPLELIQGVGHELSAEVFDELRKFPEYDELSDEDHETLLYVVKRKADVIRAIEVARQVDDKVALEAARKSAADLKSIEASIDLIHTLRVREIMKEKAKALALKAVTFAIKMAL